MKNPGRVKAGKELQRRLRKNKELNQKRIRGIILAYKNPAYKEKLSRAQHLRFRKVSGRRKIDRTMTAWWKEHPHVKKEYAERVKKYFIENPDKFKKFLEAGKNNSKLTVRTKQGYLVRSKSEKKIADYLYRNKIKSEYEVHTLLLDGWTCTPDWWLPKYNCFIEYYGGHPASWKKKTVKNRLYKKYNIPCIFITPAELRNLDYYLLHDAEKLSVLKWVRRFKVNKWLHAKINAKINAENK